MLGMLIMTRNTPHTDMRATVILLYKLLTAEQANPWVLQLLYSIIKLSQILYSDEKKRNPKQVLSLYNNVWLHMELCKDLIPTPRSILKRKMYDVWYLPACLNITCTAAVWACVLEVYQCRKSRKIIRPSEKSSRRDIHSTGILKISLSQCYWDYRLKRR